jgi:Bifunctional DNA primase/polymerase, N-terminal
LDSWQESTTELDNSNNRRRTVLGEQGDYTMLDLSKEGDLKQRLARIKEHFEAMEDIAPELSAEQLERERAQYEENLLAEKCPLFSAARSAAVHRLVLPLEPGDVKPMVPVKDASNDPRVLMDWWAQWPTANVGVVVGRAGNLIALEAKDHASLQSLMKPKLTYSESGKETFDEPSLEAGRLHLQQQGEPIFRKVHVGWGQEEARDARNAWLKSLSSPEHCWLVWSYPPALQLDVYDYRRKRVGSGLVVLGEGEVLPWAGVIGDARITAPGNLLAPVPAWLAPRLGHERSRKVMAAVAAQRAADERMMNAKYFAALAHLRALEDEERARAMKDREQADAALSKAMAEAEQEPVAEWQEPEPKPEQEREDEKTYFFNDGAEEDD